MNEQEFKNRIEERFGGDPKMRSRGRVLTGVVLFFGGILWLLHKTGTIVLPSWLIDWPSLFILIGILSGVKHGFRGGPWLLFLLAGILWFIFKQADINHDYIWPIILSIVGLMFILRPKRHHRWRRWKVQYQLGAQREGDPGYAPETNADPHTSFGDFDRRDFIDVTAVFGGVKKNVLSKSFKGGDITSFMGGSEIDLSQADISGRIVVDVTNIFGGTKLIVPSGWDVQNDITAVFGGVDDKRQINGVTLDPNKVLVLDGTCLFGGIEIRSF